MTDISTIPNLTDPELDLDEPTESHIVGPIYEDGGKVQGRTRIIEAMINGTPITALCGFVWVPTKNPDNHPLCPRCESIAKRRGDD